MDKWMGGWIGGWVDGWNVIQENITEKNPKSVSNRTLIPHYVNSGAKVLKSSICKK